MSNQIDREIIEALLRQLDPYNTPQGAPDILAQLGARLESAGTQLEGSLQARNELERFVELIPRWLAANPMQEAGALLQMRQPEVEQLKTMAREAAADPMGTAEAVGRAAVGAVKDPLGTAEKLSLPDIVGGGKALGSLGRMARKLRGPDLIESVIPEARVERPRTQPVGDFTGRADPGQRALSPSEAAQNLRTWARDASSEVTESDGIPKVLYHGTSDDLEYFDLNHPNRKDSGWLGHGVYLTSDPELARSYSLMKRGASDPTVMPLYIRLKNPYHATIDDKLFVESQIKEHGPQASIDFTNKLKAQGYDGVILDLGKYEGLVDHPYRKNTKVNLGELGDRVEYVVFDPNDLKSATKNIGTYSEGGTLFRAIAPVAAGAGAEAYMANEEGRDFSWSNMAGPAMMGMALPSSRLRKGLVRRSTEELNEPGLTDLGQIAATFNDKRFDWPEGARVLDLGGGKSDKAKDFMVERGVQMEVIDPLQRSESHNNRILEAFEENPADIVTINNVLNTIQDPALRKQALEGAKALVKPGGEVRIKIYLGSGDGKGGRTKRGTWQENRKAKDYLLEVESVFGKDNAEVRGAYIIAQEPGASVLATKRTKVPEMPEVSEAKKVEIAREAINEERKQISDPFAFPAKEVEEAGQLRQQAWPKGSGEGGRLRVLSLFDGLGGGRIALDNLDAPVEYLASEIDPYAIKVHRRNYSDTQHIGDVKQLSGQSVGPVDLLVGGSPCQDLSRAKKGGLGLEGPNSKLFYEYVRMLEETKPRYFVFENVASMKPGVKERISEIFGVKPIMIDAKDVSAQNRKRYFWTNIPVDLPKGKDIKIQDVLEKEVDPKYFHSDKAIKYMNRRVSDGRTHLDFGHHTDVRTQGKSRTLTANLRRGIPYNVLIDESGRMRKFTPAEVERLAGVPEGYTEGVSNTQRYKMLGNGFQIQVMEHILSGIPKGAK